MAEAKRRDREATAELKEFRLAELRGETIARTDAIAIYSEHVQGFRIRLFAIPEQLTNLTRAQRAELEAAIDAALAEFSRLPTVPAISDAHVDDDDFG
jgi:hypothetical protein